MPGRQLGKLRSKVPRVLKYFRDFVFDADEVRTIVGSLPLLLQSFGNYSKCLASRLWVFLVQPPELSVGSLAMRRLESIGLGAIQCQMVDVVVGSAECAAERCLIRPFSQFFRQLEVIGPLERCTHITPIQK